MKNILLANVGNRNVSYLGENISKKDISFFEFTKLLFEEIESEKDNIKLNILPNILHEYNIEKIYLFATNQGHNQDTYFEAKILEYFLLDKYEVEIVEIKNNPTIRDEAFKFFETFFDENKYLENHNLIISGSGGIPAMKEALNFYSVIKFENSIILDVNEFSGDVLKSSVDKEYLKNFDKEILESMVKNYDYSGSLSFLKKSHIKTFELEQSLKYALYRFNFNFEQSNKLFQCIKNNKKLGFLSKIEENLDKFNLEDTLNYDYLMINELIDNIEISYKKGEFSMLLGKIFRLNEAFNRYFFEKEFKVSTNKTEEGFVDFINFIELNIEIKNYCLDYGIRFEYVNNKVLSEINKKFIKNNDLFLEWQKIEGFVNNLSNTRNNSIMAHGWKGIKQDDVAKTLKFLIEYKKVFYKEKNGNFFELLNTEILKLL